MALCISSSSRRQQRKYYKTCLTHQTWRTSRSPKTIDFIFSLLSKLREALYKLAYLVESRELRESRQTKKIELEVSKTHVMSYVGTYYDNTVKEWVGKIYRQLFRIVYLQSINLAILNWYHVTIKWSKCQQIRRTAIKIKQMTL